jgi:murein DD-endopeptidase MepM/ murein hydrolase activator NlpD
MKNRRSKGILLVPPGGARVRTIRVSWIFVAALCVIVVAGFAGYFIPFNEFTLDVVKQNQERNLEKQNKKLRDIIHPLYRLRAILSSDLERLDRKRASLLGNLGKNDAGRRQAKARPRLVEPRPDELVARVNISDRLFRDFLLVVAERHDFMDSIPLMGPVGGAPVIGARFDMEKDPFTGTMKHHFGIDFVGTPGTPVVAAASGTVARVEDGKIWGKRIVVNHGFGYATVYAHLGSVEVFTGKKIKKGARIGTIGISGMSSGPHLHFEVWHDGEPIDPETVFFPETDSLKPLSLQ